MLMKRRITTRAESMLVIIKGGVGSMWSCSVGLAFTNIAGAAIPIAAGAAIPIAAVAAIPEPVDVRIACMV